jgi:succinyl-diaminopimelate desuccinylase
MPVLEKARALIARPSVTPDDAGCLDLIASWLEPMGFNIERIDVDGVSNLWARRGTAGRLICFAVAPAPTFAMQSTTIRSHCF